MASELPKRDAYECGYQAKLAGCYRVLCCGTEQEKHDWYRGYDDAAMMQSFEQLVRPSSDSCTHCMGVGEFVGRDLVAEACPVCDGFGYIVRN